MTNDEGIPQILILGCGFTGERVAARFLVRGAPVIATTRDPARLAHLAARGARIVRLDEVPTHLEPGARVVYSIPSLPTIEESRRVVDLLGGAPARVVYLSTTSVYGPAHLVDEHTRPGSADPRARMRLGIEAMIAGGPWSSLILRPAAIYGPGRGVQEAVRRGAYTAGSNYISRIHVDDLAAHIEAGLLSEVTGAYPVADQEPCTSREIAEFCARLLGVTVPKADAGGGGPVGRPVSNRRVDGSAIRRLLGIELRYPSYRAGIPAALRELER